MLYKQIFFHKNSFKYLFIFINKNYKFFQNSKILLKFLKFQIKNYKLKILNYHNC